MASYKIKGQRFLRKYTEDGVSPVYATAVQAQRIVDKFCEIPWERVEKDSAVMSYHTSEVIDKETGETGLDRNVSIRDGFDAAMFCAGHTGGMHKAYANAAVYRYEMPDDAVGKTLVSLAARVTSDPYTPKGARIHVFTKATGEIPMNCNVLRGNDASGEIVDDGTTAGEVAKRTEKLVDGTNYWYPTTETCTIAPTAGMVLQKYLFVFVGLESYSTTRGNWIEGCSYIENDVKIETSAAIEGLSESGLNDLRGKEEDKVIDDDILIRVVANTELKGKLWVQAVSYETKRALNKWSFDCDYHFGKNEMTVGVPNRRGGSELMSHHGGVFFEAWVGAEKYDVSNWYGCDNGRADHSIELTRTSAIFPRINLYEGKSDRRIVWGKDDGSDGIEIIDAAHKEEGGGSTTNREPLSGGEKNHIRIAPYLISGTKQDMASNADARKPVEALTILPNRVVSEFDIDTRTRPYITEADFVTGDKYDIYWDDFDSEGFLYNTGVMLAVGDVTAVKYGIVLGRDGTLPAHTADTTTVARVFSALVERRYEMSNARTTPTALQIREGGILYGGRLTFLWRLDEPTNVRVVETPSAASFGCSYTAFRLQILEKETDNVLYSTELVRSPVKDEEGYFVWNPPEDEVKLIEEAIEDEKEWKWRVAMFNSKFKPKSIDSINGWTVSDNTIGIKIVCLEGGVFTVRELDGVTPTGKVWTVEKAKDEFEKYFVLEGASEGKEYEVWKGIGEYEYGIPYGCTHVRGDNVVLVTKWYDRMRYSGIGDEFEECLTVGTRLAMSDLNDGELFEPQIRPEGVLSATAVGNTRKIVTEADIIHSGHYEILSMYTKNWINKNLAVLNVTGDKRVVSIEYMPIHNMEDKRVMDASDWAVSFSQPDIPKEVTYENGYIRFKVEKKELNYIVELKNKESDVVVHEIVNPRKIYEDGSIGVAYDNVLKYNKFRIMRAGEDIMKIATSIAFLSSWDKMYSDWCDLPA